MNMLVEKVYIIYHKILGTKKEIEIPEAWLQPKWDNPMDWLFHVEPTVVEPTPVAVEPIIVFGELKKPILPPLVMSWSSVKRMITVVLLAVNILLAVEIIITYSLALVLVYFVPVTIILLDYLLRTHKVQKIKWPALDDIEEEHDIEEEEEDDIQE